jgi:hypothetical protein
VNAVIDYGGTLVAVTKVGIIVIAGALQPEAVPVLLSIDATSGQVETVAGHVGQISADVAYGGKDLPQAVADRVESEVRDLPKKKAQGILLGALFPARVGQTADGGFTVDGKAVAVNSPQALSALAEAHADDFAGNKAGEGLFQVLGALADPKAQGSATGGSASPPQPGAVPGGRHVP